MEVYTTPGALLRYLTALRPLWSRKGTLNVLEHVLLEVDGATASLSATDLDRTARLEMAPDEARTESGGAIMVPARPLWSTLRRLPDDNDLVLDVRDGTVLLRCGSYKASLPTLSASEAPEMTIPEMEMEPVNRELLSELVDLVLKPTPHAVEDDGRPNLAGVYLSNVEGGEDGPRVRAITTDGHRCGVALGTFRWPGLRGGIVPGSALELWRGLPGEEGWSWGFDGRRVVARAPRAACSLAVIDARYPDVTEAVPAWSEHGRVTFSRGEMLSALMTVTAVISGWRCPVVRLSPVMGPDGQPAPGKVELYTCHESREARQTVTVEGTWPAKMGMNPDILRVCLAGLPADKVEAEPRDTLSPLSLRCPEVADAQWVLMPMRV